MYLFVTLFFFVRLEDLCSLSGKTFMSDLHLRDLLVFSTKMDFHLHYLYKAGHIILQDKVRDVFTPPYCSRYLGCSSGQKIHSIINNNTCIHYCSCLQLHIFKYDGTKLHNTIEGGQVKYYFLG